MSDSKFLSDSAWKDLSAKHKIKDTGLQKTLVDLKKVGDEAFDETLKILEEVLKQAGILKKAKDVAGNPSIAKHIAEVIAAAADFFDNLTPAQQQQVRDFMTRRHGWGRS